MVVAVPPAPEAPPAAGLSPGRAAAARLRPARAGLRTARAGVCAARQKPRLRDRIIERIPIINRFHEPDYPYPQ